MNDEVNELLINYLLQIDNKSRTRKIIFWYDDKQAYTDDIKDIISDSNTEIIIFEENSLWVRYHIEIEEPNKNFVIYFPYARKKGLDNELLDLESMNESYIFNPDQTTMWLKELNLTDEEYDIVKKNQKFFKDKKRRQKFSDFDVDIKDKNNIDLIVIACLLNIKSISVDEIFKNIISSYYDDKKKLEDLFKWGDSEYICELINNYFGSSIKDENELESLFKSLVLTYFASDLDDLNEIGKYNKYILMKRTNVHIFVDTLMRDLKCKKYFEIISKSVDKEFGISELTNTLDMNHYKYSDAFISIDNSIINALCDSLNSDVGKFDDYIDIIQLRSSKYWFDKVSNEYNALKIATLFLEQINNYLSLIKNSDIDEFSKNYIENLSEIDTLYRKFYFYMDKVETNDKFKKLKEKIENKYVNDFISELSIKWSNSLEELSSYDSTRLLLQNDFYKNYIKPYDDKKNRVIVIVSDALRYEVAKELNNKLLELGAKSDLNYMLGMIPSYTKLGMAALLPNNTLSRVDNSDDILVDGKKSSSVVDRENILKDECGESLAIKYDDLYNATKPEWKRMFTDKKIVYIYHDTIDNAGEHNEGKVFDACQEAIDDIYKLIKDLHTTFSGVNLFVTADHGFFYKKSKFEASDKLKKDENAIKLKKRYSFSSSKNTDEGYISINLDYVFGKDSGYVNVPKGNAVFSMQGLSSSYIHGGLMPQEILVPVIDFKSTRNIEEPDKVKISYSGIQTKITNAITMLDFVQNNNIDEKNRPCRYIIHFEDEIGEKVSNECVIIADLENLDVKDRYFKEKFVFKNISYDREKPYYLVITDEENGIEVERVRFVIDIAITNNFNF